MGARRTTALAALALTGAALLSSCASTDPDVERRELLNDIIDAANDRDAATLRVLVDDFVALVNRQTGEDLDAAEAARLRADAQKVKAAATLVDSAAIERRRQQVEASVSASVAASISASVEASVSASVAASVSASAAAEQERQEQEEAERSASATPSVSPTPSPVPVPPVLPTGNVEEPDE